MRELHRTATSALWEPARRVVRDSAAWAEVWSRLQAPGGPPRVDFEEEAVVVVALGQLPTPSDFPSIDSVVVAGRDSASVYVLIDRRCLPLTTGAAPAVTAAVRDLPQSVGFIERVVGECLDPDEFDPQR